MLICHLSICGEGLQPSLSQGYEGDVEARLGKEGVSETRDFPSALTVSPWSHTLDV
jgi:hypothetical protein